MKALILGANGQVGRALAAVAPPGVTVAALGRAECDIGNPGAVAVAIAGSGARLVFNAAAYTAVDRAESQSDEADLLNAAAPGWIAAACTEAGARLVHLSTDFVFDGSLGRPYQPDDPTSPLNVYGRTKRDGEAAVRKAAPDALIVRTAWVHAPQGANFVHTMLRLMGTHGRVRVVADQFGTPTFAPSLAQALWSLGPGGATGTHHYTDAGTASWYDFAVAVAEEAVCLGLLHALPVVEPVATADFPTPARRPGFSVLDKSSTWTLLGGAPPHWRVGLRACLAEIGRRG